MNELEEAMIHLTERLASLMLTKGELIHKEEDSRYLDFQIKALREEIDLLQERIDQGLTTIILIKGRRKKNGR